MKMTDVYLVTTGDPSVGIFSQTWILQSINIEDEDRDIFAEQLTVAFSVIGEEVLVTFADELPDL